MIGYTWWPWEGFSGILKYMSGTYAGTALADVLFTMVFGFILKQNRVEVTAEGLIYARNASLSRLGSSEEPKHITFNEISYSDDAAFPTVAQCPMDLESK